MSTLTVEWIRHGEASINLFENFAEDEYLDLEKNGNNYNYELYAVKKNEMYEKYKDEIDFLNSQDPKAVDPNFIIPNLDCFRIKELFRSYVNKFFTTEIDNDKTKENKFEDLTYTQIELQIDYQKFRRELIKEEEEQYKSKKYSEMINEYINLLTNTYNQTYKSKIGDFKPADSKDKKKEKEFKDIKDAARMIKYTSNGLQKIDQFKAEEKVNKTNNPQKVFASWLFMPTLSFVGTKQAEFAGKEYLSKKIETYDYILISSTVRTMMTSTISVYSAYKTINKKPVDPIQIMIAPFINEEYNGGELIHSDFANMAIPGGILQEIINLIIGWLETQYVDILEYVNINADHYMKVTKDLDYNTNSSNLEKFLDFVSTNLNPEKKQLSILAYTHGNFINERRENNNNNYTDGKVKTGKKDGYMYSKVSPFPNNLSTWIESFNYKNSKYEAKNDMTRYDNSYDNQNYGLFPEELKESKTAFRGSTIRKTLQITPIEELNNLQKHNDLGSLKEDSLRRKITESWFNWINTDPNGKKYNPLILFDTPEKIKKHSEEVFKEFLSYSIGKEWLNTVAGKEWLNTVAGKKWLLEENGNPRWIKSNNGQKWLETKNSEHTSTSPKTVGGYSKKYSKKNKNKSYKKNKKTKVYKKNKTCKK
jgi:hypothetical protein